ncbi:RTA1 like protein [Colletotrichum graminicola]|nr:RTA1 like protein [Colletotrichum graminicola]
MRKPRTPAGALISNSIGIPHHCLLRSSVSSSSPSSQFFTPGGCTKHGPIILPRSPLVVCVQTIGYCSRILSHYDKRSIGGFSIQAIFILVAPALYAASIYMILGRLIRTVRGEHLSLIPVDWVTRIFVTGDVIAFSLQAGGGGIQAAGTMDLYQAGEKIIIVGLFVQIVVFGFFVVTSLLFHYRLAKSPKSISDPTTPWKRHLFVLYITSGIILIRSIFRVVEYLQGNGGYLISHEIFLYIFDTLLMAIVMAIFSMWYVENLEGKKSKKSREERDISGSNEFMLEGTRK